MIKRPALAALMFLAACDNSGPKAPTGNDAAIAAAERKAVIDTDSAQAEAQAAQLAQPPAETVEPADQSAQPTTPTAAR